MYNILTKAIDLAIRVCDHFVKMEIRKLEDQQRLSVERESEKNKKVLRLAEEEKKQKEKETIEKLNELEGTDDWENLA
jgi:hypothetical protein